MSAAAAVHDDTFGVCAVGSTTDEQEAIRANVRWGAPLVCATTEAAASSAVAGRREGGGVRLVQTGVYAAGGRWPAAMYTDVAAHREWIDAIGRRYGFDVGCRS